MKKLSFICFSLLMAFAFPACSDDEGPEYSQSGDVTVAVPEVTARTGTSLTVSSSVSGNTESVVKRGFCYSANAQNPTIKDNVVDADESFTATISGLMGNTTYYIRAYVYGNSRYSYSETLEATTEAQELDEQLQSYVAPDYPDNYTSIADWANRGQWNLSNVHDPTVVLAEDGYYYMYQTDASYGNVHIAGGHFHGRRSKNLVDWEYLGGTMQDAPAWVKEEVNAYRAEMGLDPIENPVYGYWAPVVRKVRNGLYRMYYSIVVDNYIKTGAANNTENFDNSWTERAFIGLMETSDPASNAWEDKGMVVCSSSDKGMNDWIRPNQNDWNGYFKFNAIDPSYIITPEGRHYLSYGSWHSGIALVEIDEATGKPKAELPDPWDINEDISTYGQRIYTRDMASRWQASEGPELIYRDGYYYLFLAYDALAVPYNTRVARATNITGPYVGMDGKDVTTNGGDILPVLTHPYKFNGSNGWVGISHCCVFDDGEGNWYFASQGRFPENVSGINASNAIMMGQVRCMRWTEDGWPVVMPERYGAVPQVEIEESELVGNWENIDLSYQYGQQKTSVTMTLSADHKVTAGAWEGATWAYDSKERVLTLDNGVKLYVQRETDWEASPRTHTIVYAGYGSDFKTYWGKKSK